MAKGNGNDSDAKPSFLDISKAKAQAYEASSKAKVQACGSKAMVQTSVSKAKVANAKTWDAILSKTFGVKIPPTMTCAEEKKGKRKIIEIIVLSSDSSDDRKGPSITSVPKFKGPSVQGLLDWYRYNTIEEYLSDNYFPSTGKDIIDKDSTDEDCIHKSNSAMSKGKYLPVSQKHNPKVKSPIPVTRCVLGLANVTTWDEILNKMGVRKAKIAADKANGKRKVSYGS
ncbi:hypothetical protein Tco_0609988 [Tanacetum coccineum]